ncbi:Ppx-GppA-domain-containing protein, partial [Saccharata proteae CBS 121410]
SNGIRFSITDLTPATARLLPTVYASRADISLYDAQWEGSEKVPIPESVTSQIIQEFRRFKCICADFKVPDTHVRILATEATRVALNGKEFCMSIKDATGWEVNLLSKEDEGKVGAYGIASSFSEVRGLVMDLGGGSTQLNWVWTERGHVNMGKAVSMPYGAAALMKGNVKKVRNASWIRLDFQLIIANLKSAYERIAPPEKLKDASSHAHGIPLYLSGGGFRGWGFHLMHFHHSSPYPIPVINGFSSPFSTVNSQHIISAAIAASEDPEAASSDMHRISSRRASQFPAIAKLVDCLAKALPPLSTVHFAQGGVREGLLFETLAPEVRMKAPLVEATALLPRVTPPDDAAAAARLISAALPPTAQPIEAGFGVVDSSFCSALARSLYAHAGVPKDIRTAVGLLVGVTGTLAGSFGISHVDRAALGIALCEAHGGRSKLPHAQLHLYDGLMGILTDKERWWVRYVGRVAGLVLELWPAGNVSAAKRIEVNGEWDKDAIKLSLASVRGLDAALLDEEADWISKLGKKKKW